MTIAQNSSHLNNPLISDVIHCLENQGLHVVKKIGGGAQGEVYALRDNKTGEITSVLKTMPRNPEKFNPKKGAHLLNNVQHRNICSPSVFFYISKTGVITTTPQMKSTCVASIMPYIEGNRLVDKEAEISQEAGQIFRFGLLLCQAVRELSKYNISHEDLHDENILVDRNFNPVIIDFDSASKSSFISDSDYWYVQVHLSNIIKQSSDFTPNAKKFLLLCLQKCDPSSLKGAAYPQLPSLMVSFMQACIDHLSEIKPTPAQPVSKL